MSIAVTTTLVPTNATDAAFRAWGSGINAQLTAAGWVKTGDTGQIDWATVLTPSPATSTVQGYEIWRMDDALQATYPIYLKLEYGSGTSTNNPSIWFTVGTGSNGAGTLRGLVSTRTQITAATNAGALTCYFSGSTDRFGMALFTLASTTGIGLWIERTHDATGANTGEGAYIFARSTNGALSQQYWNWTIGPSTPETASFGALSPTSVYTTGVSGNQLAVYPIYPTKQGGIIHAQPSRDLVQCFYPDFTNGSPVNFTHLGSTRIYMPIGISHAATSRGNASGLLMRYE